MAAPPITRAQADTWLEEDIRRFAAEVIAIIPGVAQYPNRFAALISFTYNLGAGRLRASTLRRHCQAERWAEAADEFPKWVMAGGRRLPGLVRRRAAERALFLRDGG